MYKRSLFIFRKDLRLEDNTALQHACSMSKEVIACFIFDPAQQEEHNHYFSQHAFNFMLGALVDLSQRIEKQGGRLYVFQGQTPAACIENLAQKITIEALFFNTDYTPFSMKRDKKIEQIAQKKNLAVHAFHDCLLTIPGEVLNGQGKAYQIFTALYNAARQRLVPLPAAGKKYMGWYTKPITKAVDASVIEKQIEGIEYVFVPSHEHALQALRRACKLEKYDDVRDFPALQDQMSHLSCYIKFGVLSIRHIYHAFKEHLGVGHTLIKQLFWRDFFYHVAWHKPSVFGHAYQDKFQEIPWQTNHKLFTAWKEGKTGFPIVDAGMRELAQTGFMHNRVRMITASFLVKDLHISWQEGEKYFAQTLVDYDPCVNNGNWQWVAGTGCDAAPYFRVFNPWLQQKKFDAQALYIKKWVPELAQTSAAVIHGGAKKQIPGYYVPIIDHALATKKIKQLYTVY